MITFLFLVYFNYIKTGYEYILFYVLFITIMITVVMNGTSNIGIFNKSH